MWYLMGHHIVNKICSETVDSISGNIILTVIYFSSLEKLYL